MSVELQKLYDTNTNDSFSSINDWATKTLSSEELISFLEAQRRNEALMTKYQEDGLFSRELIVETVYSEVLKTNISVTIGVKTALAPGVTVLDIPIDPEFGSWHSRYSSDPEINYNPTIQV
jgi:hypothetical protein